MFLPSRVASDHDVTKYKLFGFIVIKNRKIVWKHGPKKRVVLRAYVENQTILDPILLYRASKYKQTKLRYF